MADTTKPAGAGSGRYLRIVFCLILIQAMQSIPDFASLHPGYTASWLAHL